jgi:hypothetical protein
MTGNASAVVSDAMVNFAIERGIKDGQVQTLR